jgi:hypothetical protein
MIFLMIMAGLAPNRVLSSAEESRNPTVESLWDDLARRHVKPGQIGDVTLNLVDYRAIAGDPQWKELLARLENTPVPTDRAEKLAFWINAYNVLAIKVVLDKYPVDSIRNAGGWITAVWDIDAGLVAGKMRTLTEIEHKILRAMNEPRIHAAIVCASVSCPPLRAEAFRAADLDEQLDDQIRTWLANMQVGARVEGDGTRLRVSKIFEWFPEDFGKDEASVRSYILPYLPQETRAQIKPNARLGYLDYDWSLNDSARSKSTRR